MSRIRHRVDHPPAGAPGIERSPGGVGEDRGMATGTARAGNPGPTPDGPSDGPPDGSHPARAGRRRWWPIHWGRRAYHRANRVLPPPRRRERSLHWLADYVYGTVSSLVAVAGISFDPTIDVVTAVAIVLVGAVAIWWAHALSRLVNRRAQEHLELTPGDVGRELRGAISVVVAALPAAAVLALVGTGIWTMRTGLILANVLGVVSLLAVGIGTAGGSDRPLGRRVRYVVAVVLVGVVIVVLETAVHLV